MATTYRSGVTGEPVLVQCRTCQVESDLSTAATRVRGVFSNGEPDQAPIWVPVCDEHAEERLSPGEDALPVLPLPPDPAADPDPDPEPTLTAPR